MSSASVVAEAQSAIILIIDDDIGNRLLLSSQLNQTGNYKIFNAPNGDIGIQLAQEELPDLILLDVMMPGKDGIEVCHLLKSNPITENIPVIMVTALRDVSFRIRCIRAGADEFLSRPHHREELLVRVSGLIRLKQARERVESEHNKLQLLFNISNSIISLNDIEEIILAVIEATKSALGASNGHIALVDDHLSISQRVMFQNGVALQEIDHIAEFTLEHGFSGWMIKNRQGAIIEDIYKDERWILLEGAETEGSVIGMPLISSESIIGVVVLNHPQRGYFNQDHFDLLQAVCNQVSTAIRNAYLFAEANEQQKRLNTILAQSSDAIITMSEDKKLILVNKMAESIFNIIQAEVVDRSLEEFPQLNFVSQLLNDADNRPVAAEFIIEEVGVLHASISKIPNIGYIVTMQDVTDMKLAEVQRLNVIRGEKERVQYTFARYMSPALVERVLSQDDDYQNRRERRWAVILFADLRNFTRMIINLSPDTAIDMLNQFFDKMTHIVDQNGGIIFDILGDELEVGFNVPIDQPRAIQKALKTAIEMQKSMNTLRQAWFETTQISLGLGVGIDAGDVIIGNVGAKTAMNYAMVGEAVNIAHRLVEIAEDSQIIISERIYNYISDNPECVAFLPHFTPVKEMIFKGTNTPQMIYCAKMARTPIHRKDLMLAATD